MCRRGSRGDEFRNSDREGTAKPLERRNPEKRSGGGLPGPKQRKQEPRGSLSSPNGRRHSSNL